jgi:hypothetical protein
MTPTADATLHVRFGSNWRGRSLFQGRPLLAHPARSASIRFPAFSAHTVLIGKDGKGSI